MICYIDHGLSERTQHGFRHKGLSSKPYNRQITKQLTVIIQTKPSLTASEKSSLPPPCQYICNGAVQTSYPGGRHRLSGVTRNGVTIECSRVEING